MISGRRSDVQRVPYDVECTKSRFMADERLTINRESIGIVDLVIANPTL